MDSHHQEPGRCLDSASGSGGRTRSLSQFPLPLTLAHALPLTDLLWAMPVQVVSCTPFTQPRVSTMYTLDPRPPPTQPLRPPHAPRRPTSHSRTPEIPSPSLACPPSPSSTTNSSSVTLEHVRPPSLSQLDFLLTPFPFSLPLRLASTRTYTPLKVVGDGSFGTVWLCDWHGTLPPNTPLSAMQCGPGARPEYANKRLVAVKRMKKRWEGGWDECKKLKELEVRSSQQPVHPSAHPTPPFRTFSRCEISHTTPT